MRSDSSPGILPAALAWIAAARACCSQSVLTRWGSIPSIGLPLASVPIGCTSPKLNSGVDFGSTPACSRSEYTTSVDLGFPLLSVPLMPSYSNMAIRGSTKLMLRTVGLMTRSPAIFHSSWLRPCNLPAWSMMQCMISWTNVPTISAGINVLTQSTL